LEIELTIAGSHHTISLGINLSKEHKDEKSYALKGNGIEDLEPLWGGHQSSRLVVPESQESAIELASFKTNRDHSEFEDAAPIPEIEEALATISLVDVLALDAPGTIAHGKCITQKSSLYLQFTDCDGRTGQSFRYNASTKHIKALDGHYATECILADQHFDNPQFGTCWDYNNAMFTYEDGKLKCVQTGLCLSFDPAVGLENLAAKSCDTDTYGQKFSFSTQGFVVDGPKEYVPSPPNVDNICSNNEGGFTLDKLSEVIKGGINLETVADWLGICLLEEGSVGLGGE
jgi:hypothetical protein